MIIKSFLLVTSLALPFATFASTNIMQDTNNSQLKAKIRGACSIALNPIIVNAVVDQNSKNISKEKIQLIDKKWRNNNKLTSFKYSLQNNRAGKILKSYVDNNPTFTQAYLMDNQGANVAAYPPTNDYWQGDEEKWIASFNKGNGKIHINHINQDTKNNEESINISSPVLDQNGNTVGVLVMTLDPSYLQDRTLER